MSKEFDNTNSGVMFQNDKEGNEKRPDWRGSLNVGGVEYWISCWDRETGRGLARSLKIEAKDAGRTAKKEEKAPPPKPTAQSGQSKAAGDDFEDDIPF
jgi:hypothetical protein